MNKPTHRAYLVEVAPENSNRKVRWTEVGVFHGGMACKHIARMAISLPIALSYIQQTQGRTISVPFAQGIG